MVNAEYEEVRSIGRRLAVLAGAAGSRVLVGAKNVLGTEIARAQTVAAVEDLRQLAG